MALSARLTATASRLINAYGTSVTLITYVEGAYDPVTSTSTRTATSQTVNGVIDEYADTIRFLGDKTQTNTLIKEGDKKITIAGDDLNQISPEINKSEIVIQGETFNIIDIAKQYIDNKIGYFVFHIRKT